MRAPVAAPGLAPRSTVSGLAWPGLPAPYGRRLLAVLAQLEESEWWSPEALRARQFRQLGVLLAHAFETVPFHRDRLTAAGFAPGRPLTDEIWARIPRLTRAEVQDQGAALHARALPEGHGETYSLASSGSTGAPVRTLGSALVQLFWDAFLLRDHLWHRRDVTAKLAAIRDFSDGVADYPDGLSSPSWGRSLAAVTETGPFVGLTIASDIAQQAEWLRRQQPDYLLTYPSVLDALARHCRERGIALPRLREVRTLSELVPPDLRVLCRDVWGARLVDAYSTREVGQIALQCPERPHYHVQAEGALVEILDPAGRPCAPGEMGRVVVTPLHNFAMPLIRYDLGDYAEPGGPCPCGRGLPVIARIVGRVRNLLVYPDGRRAYPLIGNARYLEVAPIRQFQLVQTSLERLEMNLVVDRPLTAEQEDRLRGLIRARTGHPFEIVFRRVAQIPRGPGGKYEQFRSEVARDGAPGPAGGGAGQED